MCLPQGWGGPWDINHSFINYHWTRVLRIVLGMGFVSKADTLLFSCRAKIWKKNVSSKRSIGYKAPVMGNNLAQRRERNKATLAGEF